MTTATQSIRMIAIEMFQSRLVLRATIGDKAFRKGLILDLAEITGCTIAAASTHYNYAFQLAKKEIPAQVVGLGRAEGKNNGGRKRKQAPAVPAPVLLLGYTPAPRDPLVFAPFETVEQYKERMGSELAAA